MKIGVIKSQIVINHNKITIMDEYSHYYKNYTENFNL